MKTILNITLATTLAVLSIGEIKAQETIAMGDEAPTMMSINSQEDAVNEMALVVKEATQFFPNFKYSFTHNDAGAPVSVKIKGVNDELAKSTLEAQLMDLEMTRIEMSRNKLLVRADKPGESK